MNRYFDMASYAQKYMEPSIEKYGLNLVRKGGDVAWLENAHCRIRLENVDNNYVRFEFSRADDLGQSWEFADFLDCMYEGRAMELRPLPPKDYGNEAKFVFMLAQYDRLLMEGRFNAPLEGDFSWVPQYVAFQAEYKRLASARYALEESGHPEAVAILHKKINGDPSWMDDVRGLLGGEGPGARDQGPETV